jgi:hypothetical protein
MQSKLCVIGLVLLLASCIRTEVPQAQPPAANKVLAENPCDLIALEHPERPAFKGMELYSWQTPESGDWVFAILYGTNRDKMVWEVVSFAMDLTQVKNCFCNMPENENVIWMPFAQEEKTGEKYMFPRPADDVINEVEKLAIACNVKLFSDSVR